MLQEIQPSQLFGEWGLVVWLLAGCDKRSRCPNHQFYLLCAVVRAVTMEKGGVGRLGRSVIWTGVFSSA